MDSFRHPLMSCELFLVLDPHKFRLSMSYWNELTAHVFTKQFNFCKSPKKHHHTHQRYLGIVLSVKNNLKTLHHKELYD